MFRHTFKVLGKCPRIFGFLTAGFLKYVWVFSDVMHYMIKTPAARLQFPKAEY